MVLSLVSFHRYTNFAVCVCDIWFFFPTPLFTYKPEPMNETPPYFQPAADSLPDPKGPLSTKLTSSTIREANEAVSRSAATNTCARLALLKFGRGLTLGACAK